MVTLSYVDSGFATPSSFVAHLRAYQGLFRQLKSFRFLYIGAKDAYFRKAEERFRTLVKRPLESDVSSEILRYFHVRKKWDNREYVVPVADDFEFLNEARRRFHGDRFETLYRAWGFGELNEWDLRVEFSRLRPDRAVFFETSVANGHGSPLAVVTRDGDGCMKDTHHPLRHRSRHPAGDAKLLGA